MKLKKQSDNEAYFAKSIFFSFLIPAFFSSFALGLGNIVDALVVGIKLGETGLAAVSFVTPVYYFYNVFCVGLGVGGSIRYGKLLGSGQAKDGLDHFNRMFYITVILGVLIGILAIIFHRPVLQLLGVVPGDGIVYEYTRDYALLLFGAAPILMVQVLLYSFVRADDGQKVASVGFIAGGVTDFVLNFVFVLGLDFGIRGAILATITGQLASIGIYLYHCFRKDAILKFKKTALIISDIWKSYIVGFSTSSKYIFSFIVYVLMNNLMMKFGGTTAVAVYCFALNIQYLMQIAGDTGVATLEPIAATYMGERNRNALNYSKNKTILWTTGISLVLAAIMIINSDFFLNLFDLTGSVAQSWGTVALYSMCIAMIIGNFLSVTTTFCQTTERETFALVISIMRTFAFYLIAMAVCLWLFGIADIWWMFILCEALTVVSAFALRFTVKKWRLPHIDETRILARIIDGSPQQISDLAVAAEGFTEQWDASPILGMRVTLMIEEICGLIYEKGFMNEDGKKKYAIQRCCIEVICIAREDGEFEIHFRDNAYKFNIFSGKLDETGLGNPADLIVRKTAKEHFYRQYQGFNTLTVVVKSTK